MPNEPEVPPQRIWIKPPYMVYGLSPEHVNGIEYVPVSALEEVWEKAIAIVMERGEILHRGNLVKALEAVRGKALSATKENDAND